MAEADRRSPTPQAAESDEQLVARVRRDAVDGRRGFAQLIERHQPRVLALLYSLTADMGVAEELAQEAFVAAYFEIVEREPPLEFKTWVLGVARNKFRMWARTNHRRTRLHLYAGQLRGPNSDIADPVEAASDPAEEPRERRAQASVAALSEDLCELLLELNDPYREVLLLRYFHGLSCPEISDALQRPLGTVTKQLSRGQNMLANALEDMRGHTTTLAVYRPRS